MPEILGTTILTTETEKLCIMQGFVSASPGFSLMVSSSALGLPRELPLPAFHRPSGPVKEKFRHGGQDSRQ